MAAITGSTAVLLAILQLAVYARPQLRDTLLDEFLAGSEYVAAGLALLAVVLGLSVAFHTRWQVLRMKTEHYRFVKFQFLLHAAKWANCAADERDKQLRKLLAGIHALDNRTRTTTTRECSHSKRTIQPSWCKPMTPLANDIHRYFRDRRLGAARILRNRPIVATLLSGGLPAHSSDLLFPQYSIRTFALCRGDETFGPPGRMKSVANLSRRRKGTEAGCHQSSRESTSGTATR